MRWALLVVAVLVASLFSTAALARGTGLRPNWRLWLEIDKNPVFANVPVGEEAVLGVELRNPGSVALRIVAVHIMPPAAFDQPEGGDAKAFSGIVPTGRTVFPLDATRFQTEASAPMSLPMSVRFAPTVPGTHRAWIMVRAEPGGLYWAFEVVGTTPGEPPPRVGPRFDQFVRVGQDGKPKLSAPHAGFQVVKGQPSEVEVPVVMRALQFDACLAGTDALALRTVLLVSPAGKVAETLVDTSLIPDAAPCVLDVIRSMTFPAHAGGPRLYPYTLVLPVR